MPFIGDGACAANGFEFKKLWPLRVEGEIRMSFEPSEVSTEGDVLVRGEGLVRKEDDEMLVEQVEDCGGFVGTHLGQRDASDLCSEGTGELSDFEVRSER